MRVEISQRWKHDEEHGQHLFQDLVMVDFCCRELELDWNECGPAFIGFVEYAQRECPYCGKGYNIKINPLEEAN